MQSYEKGDLDISYIYDADGLRASKTVNGATTTYQYVGDKLFYLCAKDATGANNYEMYFFYDSYGKLTVLKYFLHQGSSAGEYTYYVATNYFGDVVALYDGKGKIHTSYEYDAWGNILKVYKHTHSTDDNGVESETITENTSANSLAHRNPIRYRSYYNDTETGLYYLQSRYYNAEIGRFINSDSVIARSSVLGYNLLAYCYNNPVNLNDTTGNLPFFAITAAVGAVVGAVVGGVVAAKNGKNILAGIGIGAAVGGLIGVGAGATAGVLLAGSATASTASVIVGAKAVASVVGSAGVVAGMKMLMDNVSQACSSVPQVFWSGGNVAKDAAKQVATEIGGKTLEMTHTGSYLEQINAQYSTWQAASSNFANVASNSSGTIYSIQNASGVGVQSIWATIEYPLLQGETIIYGVVTADGLIQIMP